MRTVCSDHEIISIYLGMRAGQIDTPKGMGELLGCDGCDHYPDMVLVSWWDINSWPLVKHVDPWTVKTVYVIFPPKVNYSHSLVSRGMVPDPLQIPKSADVQVPFIKQHRMMKTVCPPHPNHCFLSWLNLLCKPSIGRVSFICIENNLHVSGPAQFKPMLWNFFSSKNNTEVILRIRQFTFL